jgi:alpha-N-arabinofuranosidase
LAYRNPVVRGFHPDPSVCRVGSDFYLVTSSFEYWPGVPVLHSTDLVSWRQIGHCLHRPEQLDLRHVEDSAGIWAPTIRYADGVFYVVTTVMDEGNFTNALGEDGHGGVFLRGRHLLVTATDPAGPWSDPVWISGGGLDPSLLFDHDGRVLVTHAEGGVLLQSHLDVGPVQRDAEERAIWSGTRS